MDTQITLLHTHDKHYLRYRMFRQTAHETTVPNGADHGIIHVNGRNPIYITRIKMYIHQTNIAEYGPPFLVYRGTFIPSASGQNAINGPSTLLWTDYPSPIASVSPSGAVLMRESGGFTNPLSGNVAAQPIDWIGGAAIGAGFAGPITMIDTFDMSDMIRLEGEECLFIKTGPIGNPSGNAHYFMTIDWFQYNS